MSLLDWLLRPRPDQPNADHRAYAPPNRISAHLGIELTSTPLAPGATWISPSYSASHLARVQLEAEVIEEGQLFVETSADLTTWQLLTAPSRIRQGYNSLWFGLNGAFVRFRYVNGAQNQSLFYLRLFDPRGRLRLVREGHNFTLYPTDDGFLRIQNDDEEYD